jgi:uncharacterized membrane protein
MIKKSVSIGFILLGGFLLYTGYQETQSVVGGISKGISGGYPMQTMAYLGVGVLLVLAGVLMFSGKKKRGKGK